MVNALIFDCDGVLADTERFGHLPAFNQTFAEFGLSVRWSEEEYGEKLKIISVNRTGRCTCLPTAGRRRLLLTSPYTILRHVLLESPGSA